ncbi:MAG: FKBP-type peptidyl-prolyl cis-trans isomerase [Pseudobutyrivibrio sp.]|nr:FKBP-type peptidyl-prolyl cis-trans isomerase [Pseudobutyrivibrio sp.]
MKKRVIAGILVGVMAISMIACGKSEEKDSKKETKKDKEVPTIEYNVNDLVTLGEYKNLEVTIEGHYNYSDKVFEDDFEDKIADSGLYIPDEGKTEIKEDSIVNVDYVGSQDGVAFDGGSAEDQNIDIANNCAAGGQSGYIKGFSEGLVGHKVGEEVAYDVKFPKDYGNEDLAGQTVVFTFKVNYIAKPISSSKELTDEIVSKNFGAKTVEQYIEQEKANYKQQLEQNRQDDTKTAVLNTLINNAKVKEVPKALVQARIDMVIGMQEKQLKQMSNDPSMTLKDYYETMGTDYEAAMESLKAEIEEDTKTELILQAIAEAEGIKADGKEYNKFIERIIQSFGYDSADSLYKDYTVDGFDGERYFKLAYVTEKATEFCVDNAVVNAKEENPTEASKDAQKADEE